MSSVRRRPGTAGWRAGLSSAGTLAASQAPGTQPAELRSRGSGRLHGTASACPRGGRGPPAARRPARRAASARPGPTQWPTSDVDATAVHVARRARRRRGSCRCPPAPRRGRCTQPAAGHDLVDERVEPGQLVVAPDEGGGWPSGCRRPRSRTSWRSVWSATRGRRQCSRGRTRQLAFLHRHQLRRRPRPCASRCTRLAVSASGASTRQNTLPGALVEPVLLVVDAVLAP